MNLVGYRESKNTDEEGRKLERDLELGIDLRGVSGRERINMIKNILYMSTICRELIKMLY